jgi:hypothetical protein
MIALFTEVWTSLVTWFVTLFPAVQSFFVTTASEGGAQSLTFAGVCAVVMAGISLILLVFNLIRSLLPMRG